VQVGQLTELEQYESGLVYFDGSNRISDAFSAIAVQVAA